MKKITIFLILIFTTFTLSLDLNAQIVQLSYPTQDDSTEEGEESGEFDDGAQSSENTVEWFEGGNIDFISSGLIQTSARLLKINIGEPNSFYLPFYILAGATSDVSNDEESANENTTINLLSSNGGYLNLGIHGKAKLKGWNDYTSLSLSYQLGAKTINGLKNDSTGNVQLLSGIGNVGLFFQTAAWNPDDIENIGVAWLQLSFASTLNDEDKIQLVYGEDVERFFYGINIEAGVEIEQYVNLRLGYYNYFNNQEITNEFDKGIFKLSVDFKLKQ